MRGASLLDLIVALAVLALLIALVRLDWRHVAPPPQPTAQPAR
jgi:hypothetical protein